MVIWRVEHKVAGYGPFTMFHDFEYVPEMVTWFDSRHTEDFPTAWDCGLIPTGCGRPRPCDFHGLLTLDEVKRWFGDVAEHLDEFSFVVRKYVCSWKYVTTSPKAGTQVLFEKDKATAIETHTLISLFGEEQ